MVFEHRTVAAADAGSIRRVDAEKPVHRVVALSCTGLSLAFPLFEKSGAWRILLGKVRGSQTIPIFDDVSLAVPKGEFVGILGRNGAGKSSLLRTLGGIYPAISGRMLCLGGAVGLFDLGAFGQQRLTGREYARRFLLLQGASRRDQSGILEEICQFSELDDKFDRPLFTYSSGMLARLYFSAATAIPHAVYLIDEFLMVGDEYFQGKCWRRMRERMAEGAAGVLVTHDWTLILKLCEQAHLMHQGRIVQSGPSDQIVCSYLNLPTEGCTQVASFTSDMPCGYHAQAQEDAEFLVCVQVNQAVPVVLNYSIEILQPGTVWGILLMGEDLPITSAVGRYEVRLRIPRLPLTAGTYLMNVFLKTSPTVTSGELMHVCDARSWTYGNALSVTVHGAPSHCFTSVPIDWVR
ncbi:MAG: ABC transporter ATP-binding protein [Nitrospiraceae bacterium]